MTLFRTRTSCLVECRVRGNDRGSQRGPFTRGGLLTLSSDFDPLLLVGSITLVGLPSDTKFSNNKKKLPFPEHNMSRASMRNGMEDDLDRVGSQYNKGDRTFVVKVPQGGQCGDKMSVEFEGSALNGRVATEPRRCIRAHLLYADPRRCKAG